MKWDSSATKSHLRYASQRLGQEQARHNSQATMIRADIATLIQQGNVLLAREKAEKLIQEEGSNTVLEVVETQIGVVMERFQELEQGGMPSPAVVEAASTIIYSAPYINSRDVDAVRDILIQHLGSAFSRSVMNNRDGYVSRRVLQAISRPIPSAYHLDCVLHNTCKDYDISWVPNPSPRQLVLNSVSECLDMTGSPRVDLLSLRKLCQRGLPDEPAWLRPRIWKILFGLVSPIKSSWATELSKQRESYYDFVRRLLKPFSEPGISHDHDDKVSEAYKELSGLPRKMFSLLGEEPEQFDDCPLSDEAIDSIRIPYARILETKLDQLNEVGKEQISPEIRLATEVEVSTPGISITSFDSGIWENGPPVKTLLASRKCMFGNAHAMHCSVLLRLLYLHNAVNPAKASSHTASLLVPLYSVMLQEVDTEALTHVEADTFWLLESIVAELSEVDEDGGRVWIAELGKRLSWADYDFFIELESQGLNPALPHYSYRWLAPLLSHTLPLDALFQTWDALFSRESREKGSNPKADYLVDICTSMILRGKNHLNRVWKVGQSSGRGLWTNDNDLSPLNKAQDPFLKSLSFLQTYDLKYVGGIERVLQTAAELAQRRQAQPTPVQSSGRSLKSRFNFWSSAAASNSNGSSDTPSKRPASEPQGHTRQSSLTSQFTSTVWKGITNQTAMEDETPSPPESHSPAEESISHISEDTGASSSNIWGYAEKIKDSDTVATLSKVSSNWRAKGILYSWRSQANTSDLSVTVTTPNETLTHGSIPENGTTKATKGSETRILLSPPTKFLETSPVQSLPSSGSLVDLTKTIFSPRSPPPSTPKSGPKPLLLTSTRLSHIGSSPSPRSSPVMQSPDVGGDRDDWAEVMKLKRHHFHRESQSSASSLSPDAFIRAPKSDWESDTTTSRIVPLNRRALSPMAPQSRRPSSRASSASSDIHSPPTKAKSPLTQSNSIDAFVKGKASSPSETDPESSDTTSYPTHDVSKINEDTTIRVGIPGRTARIRTRRYPRPANLQIPPTLPVSEVVPGPKSSDSSKNLKVEFPADNQDNATTPKAANFEHSPTTTRSGLSRSPRRSMSRRDTERQKKALDDAVEERPRKTSARSRKVSGETTKVRRRTPAEDGDDEGYDELLSAYESEDTNHLGLSPRK